MIKISQINLYFCINGVVRGIQNVPPFAQGVISRLLLYFSYIGVYIYMCVCVFVWELVLTGNFEGECCQVFYLSEVAWKCWVLFCVCIQSRQIYIFKKKQILNPRWKSCFTFCGVKVLFGFLWEWKFICLFLVTIFLYWVAFVSMKEKIACGGLT